MSREQIQPVQVIFDGKVHAVPYFRNVGTLGVSAFAFENAEDPTAPIYFTSGSELCRLDLSARAITNCISSELIDVHEIVFAENRVLVANTGRDEVLIFYPESGDSNRISLDSFRRRNTGDVRADFVDHFHVNQIFEGLHGNLWALVHHFRGRQFLRRVIGGMIKSHGDGGLLNITRNEAINLNLSAPHSVRVVHDEYWLMNSGCSEIAVYSPAWKLKRTFRTTGWGRGLAISGEIAYAGISPVRRRYRSLFEKAPSVPVVQALDIHTGTPVASAQLQHVEQINNLYCISRSVALSLINL